MTIAEFDHLDITEKRTLLYSCCGSNTWVNNMLTALPAEDLVDLLGIAEEQWYLCHEPDWKEAFSQHPKIGDVASLKQKFAATAQWTEGEQASVKEASEQTLQQLAAGNQAYEQRFGYIFIVCATGKSADEMLQLLQQRLYNNPEVEIQIAMEEQLKITNLRLEKLFGITE
ncbi:OHCU decarboxylase [Niastella koreensis]|uniref:2-oxo-4-hydroxy-4-carboxy-5-ureidoimidazoline decarboxylase n=2 Tax=Niastella koreensis TaxID=354356 RepID=G8T6J1_NIAKG|nr:2-oxo-4-hydroxy-4-carboxy-5-ureidoimidazoline decarboxylase [Niastella koreensis]AEV96836.1 OHCU decarboxylase [Niastella koreensis GR20-10]OQP49184.1 OHCU decarboxylase [Niastella koreensis]